MKLTFKNKKIFLIFITLLYILLSIIEFIKYMFVDSNLFGLIYTIFNVIIMFLLLPTTLNYKKNYSSARISKLIIVIVFGFFSTFFLQSIINASMPYIDESYIYIEKIFVIKNIFKIVIYILVGLFVFIEIKTNKKNNFFSES